MFSNGTKDLSKVTQAGVLVVPVDVPNMIEVGPRRIEGWSRRIEGVTIGVVEKRTL